MCLNISFSSFSIFLYEKQKKLIILSNKSSQSDGVTKQKKANGLSFGLFHQNSNGYGCLQEIDIFKVVV